ncbi:class I SAM-dependent methyltransferase [Sporolactobacillus shoreae]|uniref:Class I SAM-dependent methyltransferase n=1 Tax=Sporolactobacillus shoreae TaxID=1465501 RepID=A0A4Z0GK81_9BACL|nr:class I SAM-dependent methyltransferase [Sporolactobacillus shoreae]TGA96083.1 class I SAM-dependent methyltransferase [Sporolactobacillus shoreae]
MHENPSRESWQNSLLTAIALIDQAKVPCTVTEEGALILQGVVVPFTKTIRILIQWDALENLHYLFQPYKPTLVTKNQRKASFMLSIDDYKIELIGLFGTVIRTDPDRVPKIIGTETIYVKSVYYFLTHLQKDHPLYQAVKDYLQRLQSSDAAENGKAWNEDAFQAWVRRFGTPEQVAEKIRRDPVGRLAQLAPYFSDVNGKKIMNLLGSHGGKALALSLLGADVSVIDISEENAEYARQTAAALKTHLNYIVSDVLQLPEASRTSDYDLVFMELGILHYFVDLEPLAELIFQLLKPGGKLILQEFHPISTKLVTTRGKKQIVFGNYFDQEIREREVAYGKHLSSESPDETLNYKVFLREWTLGEIVTSFARKELRVEELNEIPNSKISDIGLPKLFTLVCSK